MRIKEIKQIITPVVLGEGATWTTAWTSKLHVKTREGRMETGRGAGCLMICSERQGGRHWLVSFAWSSQGSKGQTPGAKMKDDLETLSPSLLGRQAAEGLWIKVEDTHRDHGKNYKPISSSARTPPPPWCTVFEKSLQLFLESSGDSGNAKL